MLSLALFTLVAFSPGQQAPPPPKLETVVFATPGDLPLRLDIYRPTSNKSPGCAILLVHGGGWMSGTRKDVEGLARALAVQGFLSASVDYRLAPVHTWPTMLDDCQAAVRYLRKNAKKYNIHPKRIAALGESAGAHLSLLLGSLETRDTKTKFSPGVSSRVNAVFDIYGPTDFAQDYGRSMDHLYEVILGKKRADAGDLVKTITPMQVAHKKSAPTFILHGTADTSVPVAQSRRMHARFRELGVPCEYAEIDGMGHSVDWQNPNAKRAVIRGMEFVRAHLSKLK